ncbi:MAG: metallophosphoesterase [Synechococcus sp.]|nr:metallophosphoesterase [Synechococcus sp.]
MRVLQLSDPHLLADPDGNYRERRPLPALAQALRLGLAAGPVDVLLLSGDLCQDETWGGYARLRDLLAAELPPELPVALLPGNHDHPFLLRAALGRRAVVAPAELPCPGGRLLLLDSHLPGAVGGRLGAPQRHWLAERLRAGSPQRPTLVGVHHPPLPIGDPGMDAIGLADGAALLELLADAPGLQAVVFGHIHQHWSGQRAGAEGLPVALLGCPSTLCAFPAVQPCPLGRPQDPGGRLLRLDPAGLQEQLLRWAPPELPSLP